MTTQRPVDLLLTNGRVHTGVEGAAPAEAVAITANRVVAVGSAQQLSDRVDADTTVRDVGGRRVIPGLIDSHLHFGRAGLTWDQQVDWSDVTSLEQGLAAIEQAAAQQPPGTWIPVLGGWHPHVFPEGRGPTPEELTEVAPDHPAYVQLLYESAVLNGAGLETVGIDADTPDPPGGSFDRDDHGHPTGHLRGVGAFGRVVATIGRPGFEDQIASLRSFARRLNELGLTGVIDPGGMGMDPTAYRALHELRQRDELTLRTSLYLMPSQGGGEVEQLEGYVKHLFPGFGDEFLKVVGMGEILHFGCTDLEGVGPFEISEEARAELLEITLLAVRNRWPVHLHAVLPSTIDTVLSVWEEAAAQVPRGEARFSLAHAEPISDRDLDRVAALAAGIAVQDRMVFRGADSAEFWGEEIFRRSPPLRSILDRGIPLGAGTDATVVSPYDPWRSLWWLVTGRSLDGGRPRDPSQCLTREEALRAYTQGSAWFSYDEDDRGTLEPGKLADVAVLSADYLEVADEDIPAITSVLTVVDGRIVHDALDGTE